MTAAACALLLALASAEVSDRPMQWHPVTLTWTGPQASEQDTSSPFVAYRLDVTFRHEASGTKQTVPGFFAADGDAANTSAEAGDKWRARFAPSRPGTWSYAATLTRHGDAIALDGADGTFEVAATDAPESDFRAHGTLRHNAREGGGSRYFRFVGSGERFLFAGANSPETLLGYHDFDGTFLDTAEHPIPAPRGPVSLPSLDAGLHRYAPHEQDWRDGDPTWKDGLGKGLIGGMNYLSDAGGNSMYFVTMNVNGDGRNVWPWTGPWEHDRFDVSKLAQWDIVFEHMQSRGIVLHVVLQETENDHILDDGETGPLRSLYLREMVARFAHHPGILWNLGEENLQTIAQQKAMADALRSLDSYGHPIAMHNDHYTPTDIAHMYDPILGAGILDAATIQEFDWNDVHTHTRRYVERSAAAGQPWVVLMTEMGGASFGLPTDAEEPDHFNARTKGLWGNLMAGGGGVEWYFGWQNNSPASDLSAEDWRLRDSMWRQSRLAIDFLGTLPLEAMQPAGDATVGAADYVLAQPGEVYAIFLPSGGSTRLVLDDHDGPFSVRWFDPRNGGELQAGSKRTIWGGEVQQVGDAPGDAAARGRDWVCLVRRAKPIFTARGDGRIVIEADHYESQTNDSVRRWHTLSKSVPMPDAVGAGEPTTWVRSILSAASKASRSRFVRVLPDTRKTHGDELLKGENFSDEPGQMAVLNYRVRFDQPGRYYVWARGFSVGTEDNSLHVGLNGDWPEHGRRMQWCEGKNEWTWSNAQRTEANHCGEPHGIYLDVAEPGVHTLAIAMREDGVAIDQLLLTTDREYTPGGPQTGERIADPTD